MNTDAKMWKFPVLFAAACLFLPVVRGVSAGAAEKAESGKLAPGEEMTLFNGKDLKGWEVCNYAGHGDVKVEDGRLILEMGAGLTGVRWTNTVPATVNYEISLEAMRIGGYDFFCGLTFPVKDSNCSLILGGWGGGVTGLSSINGYDASMNETTGYRRFENKKWYKVRVRVTDNKIEAWLDGDQLVDVDYSDKQIDVRIDIEDSRPLGLASWQTIGAIRNVNLRRLPE